MSERRGPVVIEAELPESEMSPGDVPPVPDTDLPAPTGQAMRVMTARAARGRSWAGRLFWSALSGLVVLMAGVVFWDFVSGLITRNPTLGRVAMGLGAVVVAMLVFFLLREAAALMRLGRVDALRRAGDAAWESASRPEAQNVARDLSSFYAGRAELRWARGDLAAQTEEILDGDALLGLAETRLLSPLDAEARLHIEASARQVAAATAFVPLALADVAVALVVNMRMIRRIAEVYGGRAGYFGSLRLLRAVSVHLVATGAVAIGDDLIGSVAGGGVLSKISRRFGEGFVNGALTARVGIAAMEICRPMPFREVPRPRVGSIVKSALTGMFGP